MVTVASAALRQARWSGFLVMDWKTIYLGLMLAVELVAVALDRREVPPKLSTLKRITPWLAMASVLVFALVVGYTPL